ncbi:MAG TPA: hypothetical protein PKD54_15055, partial [Pirellulaceae bacterium]|nr:hypothetical protein [Pirellulaceae bacterium]
NLVGREEGIVICPETALCLGALQKLIANNQIRRDESVVVFNTAAGQKYIDHLDLSVPEIDLNSPDWSVIESNL